MEPQAAKWRYVAPYIHSNMVSGVNYFKINIHLNLWEIFSARLLKYTVL